MTTNYSSKEYLELVDRYWRAADYVSVGQLYLKDNPLLDRPLVPTDIKVHPIGHWGTISGQNFIYAHLNRVINKYDLDMFYIEGPGHGGQVMVSNSYLDGSYTETYPEITQDKAGMQKLFKRFSFPGGVASHADPKTPGSIHEGGELGYSLLHGAGAILDNPNLIAATVIGDGEAETGPLATSWQVNKFINPINDGTVLPILNLNGFKISNPTVLSRMSHEELTNYFKGLGWNPHFVEGTDPKELHVKMADELDSIIEEIMAIRENAVKNNDESRPAWPMLVFRAPKGWGGPKEWDGDMIEGSFRAHQIPIPVDQNHTEHLDSLVSWLKSYKPEELFDENGALLDDIKAIIPDKDHRMSSNPVTNGGKLSKPLILPDPADFEFKTDHGTEDGSDMTELGKYIKAVFELNKDNKNFRGWGPDESLSNKLSAVFEETNRQWLEPIHEGSDALLAPHGRMIDSMLSEHMDEGMLEAYTLTGRHGFFASYESFLRVVDSMLTQHFKWLRNSHEETPWREDVPSLNIISTSTAFQQDHNGYSHQDPGIVTHLAEKKTKYIREYFPADANTLIAAFDKSLRTKQVINLIVASKHPRLQWYSAAEAKELVDNGLKIIDWASNVPEGEEPDVVFASAGSEPNLESLAAISILRKQAPSLKIRYVNVVDLLKLKKDDPRGLSDAEFDAYFTKDKPVIFAFHGYVDILKDIFFDRHNHNLHLHGYKEEGDITTPFDMRVRNELDRFHLVKDALEVVPGVSEKYATVLQDMDLLLQKHHDYIRSEGDDIEEVRTWKWDLD
ncbi:phosphoketolase family protein [Ligilactobacillus salivarius]|uniref:Probable phosphoketolase n=1 Tax=Ligilactobacillus salivarius TaxID=1624 RepID=A0A1D7TTX9_9LACO|nr:phosphoketolase family protein [Ligilactobacillus salivarius]AOO74420.1 phosphoketolase [Ligilactobacillus salivarius]UDE98231.1 phosphoketolase family protein [Ligilactobacillus salivarius]UUV97360.1 phosphoketolase family protein [Ligilactobacillus salivarius]